MKKQIKILVLLAFVFGLGFGSANIAMSDATAPTIAVVNVDKILNSSAQVSALKKDQEKKAIELRNWLKTAQADVDKQSTPQTKQATRVKYEKELAAKREANNKAFASQLATIDKNVTNTISRYAKAKGYPVVIAKSVVIYGGTDITNEVAKLVK